MTDEEKAQALLNSPAGCSAILDISENSHLGTERLAEPEASFWFAASAVAWCDVRADVGLQERLDLALNAAKDVEDLALRIVSNPAFAWWYEPVDLDNQIWTSPQIASLPPDPDKTPPFQPGSWRKPAPPNKDGDPFPNTYSQDTSTLRGATTSEVTAYAIYAADHACAFPLAAWRVRFEQEVRVREINHPADWHALCLEFPHRAPTAGWFPTGVKSHIIGTGCTSPSAGCCRANRSGTRLMANGQ